MPVEPRVAYKVYHNDDPENFKIIKIPQSYIDQRGGTSMAIKDFACKNGYFSWEDYTKLKTKKWVK